MQYNVGFATHIGMKRSKNQDNLSVSPDLGLFLVADGMGGHRGGETASSIAAEVVPQWLTRHQRESKWDPDIILAEGIRAANSAIYKKASEEPDLEGMGTTTTALLIKDRLVTIGHVGDSRCYLIKEHALWQATRDHSLVQEKIRAGLITREQARSDRMRNVITRSVGFEPTLDVEIYQLEASPGDTFLLCSDGLTGLISDEEILAIVEKDAVAEHNPKAAVDALIQAANEAGGDDNITVVIVTVSE